MELNLELAFEQPVELSLAFEIPPERLAREELLSLTPATFAGRLERSEQGFVLTGRLAFEGSVTCARCLNPVPFSGSEDVVWLFVPAHQRPAAEETELDARDPDLIYYDDFKVRFDPLIEEQLQLELPMKALCREDCKGLCPSCGADLNAVACGCKTTADERWGALKALRAEKS